MTNELIFITHCFICAVASTCALSLGPYSLCSLIGLQCILSNLLVLKQVVLFGFVATCADPFTIGATLGLNLLQEFYGKVIAKKTIYTTFFLLIFYTIITYIHQSYIPAAQDIANLHYQALFAWSIRITSASLSTYFIVQWLDYGLYGILKSIYNNRFMHIRTFISISICQAIDTILFTFLGLGGIVANPWDIITVSYMIKLIAIACSVLCIKCLLYWAPRSFFKRTY